MKKTWITAALVAALVMLPLERPKAQMGGAFCLAIVIVAAADVRVNPRQGLKWALAYRSLGGSVELWFDPNGAHDCWGAGMPPDALFDWVDEALARTRARNRAPQPAHA